MAASRKSIVAQCVRLMGKPLVSLCVRRGIKFREFSDILKQLFVEAAKEEIYRQRYESSTSKISIMTGLQRLEVKRLLDMKEEEAPEKSLIARVIGLWSSSVRFSDSRGRARKLSYRGNRSDFARLVRSVSKDLNPHTVLFELDRLGVLIKEGELVALKHQEFVPQGDPEESMRLVSTDAKDLLSAGSENAFSENALPHLHAHTEYDNVPDESLPEIREWFLELGRRVHAECRGFLSKFDRDITPDSGRGTGQNRIVLGTFSYTEPSTEPMPESDKNKKGRAG